MRQIVHMCLDVRGTLMNCISSQWNNVITNDSNRKLSSREAKHALLDELAKGHYKIPIGSK